MKGIALFKQKEFKSAKGVFEKMENEHRYNSTTVIYHYLTLEKLGEKAAGLALLERESVKFDAITIYHYLAHAYWHDCLDDQAIQVYENRLLKLQPHSRQFWLEYARMVKPGNPEKMKTACRRVLDGQSFPLPRTAGDFFYDGFANFLLGEHQRARYDFERSGDYCSYYYDQIPD
jgi:tetratricopeptide (TPR) repeat protein